MFDYNMNSTESEDLGTNLPMCIQPTNNILKTGCTTARVTKNFNQSHEMNRADYVLPWPNPTFIPYTLQNFYHESHEMLSEFTFHTELGRILHPLGEFLIGMKTTQPFCLQ